MKFPKPSVFSGLLGAFALSALSAFADPIVLEPDTVTDRDVRDGLSITLPVVASSNGTGSKVLTYQWKKRPSGGGEPVDVSDGGGISGATTANLKFTNANAGHAGNYFAEVTERSNPPGTDPDPVVNAPDYVLKVNVRPKIATNGQPVSATVDQGDGVTFSVTLTPESTLDQTFFQWTRNNVDIPGATESTYTIPAATEGNELTDGAQWQLAGNYAVKINSTKTATKITSKAAVLKVNSQPVILTQPSAGTGGTLFVPTKGSAKTTVVAGGNPKLEYQWEKETETPGTYVDVSGAKAATLSLPGQDSSEGKYRVRVKNGFTPLGSAGTYSNVVTVVVLNKPGETATIAADSNNPAQPNAKGEFTVGQFGEVGSEVDTEVTLTVSPNLTETGVLSFQWQKDGKNIADGDGVSGSATTEIKFSPLKWVHRGVYRCIIKNGVGSYTSKPYTLKVNSPPVILTDSGASLIAVKGKPAVLSVVAGGTAPLTYQWYKVDPDGDILQPKGKAAKFTQPAQDDIQGSYYCKVKNDFGEVLSQTTVLRVDTPVKISAPVMNPPKGPVVGGTLTLSILVAEGDGPINLQWQRNNVNLVTGGDIAGATATIDEVSQELVSMVISNVTLETAGSYRCIATNAGGAVKVTSATVKVKVLEAPSIQNHPESLQAVEGSTVNFSVAALGSPTLKYQWQQTAANLPGVPVEADYSNITGNATATKATLTLKTVNFTHSRYYRCIINNDTGIPATSSPARLTVAPIPNATVTAITPHIAMTNDKIRVTGTDLQYVTEAYFGPYGTNKATITKESNTSLLLTLPAGVSTSVETPITLKSKYDPITTATPNVVKRSLIPVNDRNNPKILLGSTFPVTAGRTFDHLTLGQLPASPDLAECAYTWVAPKAGRYMFTLNSNFQIVLEIKVGTLTTRIFAAAGSTGFSREFVVAAPNTAMEIKVYGDIQYPNANNLSYFGSFTLTAIMPRQAASQSSAASVVSGWELQGQSATMQEFAAEDGSESATFTGSSSQGGQPTVIWKDASDVAVEADSVVRTEWTMEIDKSGAEAPGHFAWQVAGREGSPLGQLQVSVSDGKLYAVEADGTRTELAPQLVPGSSNRFEITTDLGQATWQVRVNGVAQGQPLPLPANSGFGDVSVIWYPASSGARPTMTFDDVTITVD